MLKTLTVWNFALLEHVKIEFGAGLNILTGETGAGKSLLIDALGAVLGKRLGDRHTKRLRMAACRGGFRSGSADCIEESP